MYDLANSLLPFLMDVYVQADTQDESTGAIKREWQFTRTVSCSANSTITNSSTRTAGHAQSIGKRYLNEQMLQIRTIGRITLREKITNIRDAEGTVIWEETNFPNNTPTVFEVMGVTPITEPLGGVIGYNSIIKRSESQVIGQ